MPFEHRSIQRANLMRQNDQPVTDHDLLERNIGEPGIQAAMSYPRHAIGKRVQHRRSAPRGILIERRPAGEHQHHNGGDQIFAHQDGGHNGRGGQKVRPKFTGDHVSGEHDNDWNAAHGQRDDQGSIEGPLVAPNPYLRKM